MIVPRVTPAGNTLAADDPVVEGFEPAGPAPAVPRGRDAAPARAVLDDGADLRAGRGGEPADAPLEYERDGG